MSLVRDGAVILPRYVETLAVGGTLAASLWLNGIEVCVKYIPVTALSTAARITVRRNQTVPFLVTYSPTNATDRRIRAESLSSLIEVVNPGWMERLVTIKAGGTTGDATLRITSIDGPTRICPITVQA
jgi:hypothetical protein